MGDSVDVDSTGGDVGRDQDGNSTRSEGAHDVDSFVLILVGMNRIRTEFVGPKVSDEPVGSVLGLGEDQCALHRIPFKQGA